VYAAAEDHRVAAAEALLFRDLAYVFAAALLGGIVIGPFTPGPTVSDVHTFELLAEIGVILLMFSIGIEFSLRDLLRVKWVAIVGAPLGILLAMLLGVGVGLLAGWSVVQGVVVGAVISVASTMVLARLLLDRGELQSAHGRVMIGITLVEDLAVVVLTVLLPSLSSLGTSRLLAVGRALLIAAVILVPFTYLAFKVVPRVMTRVARTGSEELFLLVALAIALGTAAVTQAAGLSLALGAFLGGLIISQSDHAHDALARLLPVRDAFVALFFVAVGTLVNPAAVVGNPGLLATLIALVVPGKFVIWTAVVRAFGYPLATAALIGVGLTQIGEFSFILVQVARTAGLVGDDVYNATLTASLLTVLINAALVRWVPGWLPAPRPVVDAAG
jgi:CPA2 family monovalent cation:H+ antiporter-2